MKGPANDETEADKAAWEGPETADHAKRLLNLEFFEYLSGLLENNTLYALKENKLFEWRAEQQLGFMLEYYSLRTRPVLAEARQN